MYVDIEREWEHFRTLMLMESHTQTLLALAERHGGVPATTGAIRELYSEIRGLLNDAMEDMDEAVIEMRS